jgi:hypothetical protein
MIFRSKAAKIMRISTTHKHHCVERRKLPPSQGCHFAFKKTKSAQYGLF